MTWSVPSRRHQRPPHDGRPPLRGPLAPRQRPDLGIARAVGVAMTMAEFTFLVTVGNGLFAVIGGAVFAFTKSPTAAVIACFNLLAMVAPLVTAP